MLEGGVTLPSTTLTSLSLSSNTLPSTELVLCLWLIEGMFILASYYIYGVSFSFIELRI